MALNDPHAARRAVAWVAAGLVFVVSYTAQRALVGAGPDPRLVVATVHIPYFWRVGLAALQAAMAWGLVNLLVDEVRAARWLERGPWVAVAVALPSMLALAWMA